MTKQDKTTPTWFKGTSCPTMHLKQYMRADKVTARGAFILPNTSFPVPVKSNTAVPYEQYRSMETKLNILI